MQLRDRKHPALKTPQMQNVLEKLRSGEPLTDKDKIIHERRLVSVLQQIHDELDAAVFAAYGWPVTLTDAETFRSERWVALNAERAAEERRGLIRWLRPEFQNPADGQVPQTQLAIDEPADNEADDEEAAAAASSELGKQSFRKPVPQQSLGTSVKLPFPEKLPEQVLAIRQQLAAALVPLTAAEMAQRFTRGNADRIEELLQSLVTLASPAQWTGRSSWPRDVGSLVPKRSLGTSAKRL